MKKKSIFITLLIFSALQPVFGVVQSDLKEGADGVTITAKNTDGSTVEIIVIKADLAKRDDVKALLMPSADKEYSGYVRDLVTSLSIKVDGNEVLTLNGFSGIINANSVVFHSGKNRDFKVIIYGGSGAQAYDREYYFDERDDGFKPGIFLVKEEQGGGECCRINSRKAYFPCTCDK
ncbi:MAG: hypothetical protein ABSA34_04680 [Candidatus Goldiibacteriota bacterium]|jgi:hypothetical protein